MKLSHWSEKPISQLRNVAQAPPRSCYDKPRGLWVSVDGDADWEAWCKAENFGGLGEHRYTVTLGDGANILHLKTAGDLERFTRNYGGRDPLFPIGISLKPSAAINWPVVAAQFDGIIIAPYCWQQRLKLDWYYGWDCASGCIWNAQAVRSIELLEPAAKERGQ